MVIAHLVDQYGYAAVLVGSLLEGETVLLLAGAAVHQGLMSFPAVVALAFCGGTLGDQMLFLLGRRHGQTLLQRFPGLAQRAVPVERLILRHQSALIVGVRFMYGLRLIGPFAIGMSVVDAGRFALLNMLGAAIWAPLIVGLGYVFGRTVQWLIDGLGQFEAIALGAIVALAVVAYLVQRRRRVVSAQHARAQALRQEGNIRP